MVPFSCRINKTLLIAFVNATFSEEPCLLINKRPLFKKETAYEKDDEDGKFTVARNTIVYWM